MAKLSTIMLCALAYGTALADFALGQAQTLDFYPTQWVGIQQTTPDLSSPLLRWRLNATSGKQAMIYMDVIGNGPGQIPPGSQITLANLRIRAISGGDGWLYRAAEPWDETSTWNAVGGDVAIIGAAKGAGIDTATFLIIPVTDHVQLWANGTYSYGWVFKGAVNDTTDTEIYDGNANQTALSEN